MPNINTIRPWLRAIEGPGAGGSGGVKTPDPAPEATTTVDASGDAAGAGGGEAKTPPAGDKGGGDEGAGSKAAVLADLARERDKRQALEARIAELEGKAAPPAAEKNTTTNDPDPLAELVAKITSLEEKVTGRDTAEWTEAAIKKFNIPAAMSGRITGTTEAEIQADAQALAQALGLNATDASQGRGGGRGQSLSMADAIAAHYTNNSN